MKIIKGESGTRKPSIHLSIYEYSKGEWVREVSVNLSEAEEKELICEIREPLNNKKKDRVVCILTTYNQIQNKVWQFFNKFLKQVYSKNKFKFSQNKGYYTRWVLRLDVSRMKRKCVYFASYE